MRADKFHEMKTEELTTELKELRDKLFKLRFSHATGQLGNPKELTLCRKDIARVKTILKERELKIVRAKGATAEAPKATAVPAKAAK